MTTSPFLLKQQQKNFLNQAMNDKNVKSAVSLNELLILNTPEYFRKSQKAFKEGNAKFETGRDIKHGYAIKRDLQSASAKSNKKLRSDHHATNPAKNDDYNTSQRDYLIDNAFPDDQNS